MGSDEESVNYPTDARQYRTVFRSASIMGGASALNMAIGLLRVKVMAVLLGPAGTGLVGLYSQITGLVGTVSNFGIIHSGVRQIAEAAGTGDDVRIARTDLTLRRAAWLTGSFGTILQLSLCWYLSQWTFRNTFHWQAIAVLSIIPLLQSVSGGQSARIQGLGRIGDLARQSVLGALAGTSSSILLIWYLGISGIVPQMIVVAASSLAFSTYYSRKVRILTVGLRWKESAREAKALLGLGFSFMGSGVMGALATYLIAAMIVRRLGVTANGLYLAAWSLSGLYATFVLGAMGADYYPRLTAVAKDKTHFISMVNRQAEVSLLIAAPGIVGTLAFAPWAIGLFYSPAYAAAYEIMRWLILAVFLRVIIWPLSYIFLAKGAAFVFLATETFYHLLSVLLVSLLIGHWGLTGVGVAIAIIYACYTVLVFMITSIAYGFRYSRDYPLMLALFLALTLGAFFLTNIPNEGLRYGTGAILTLVTSIFSWLILKRLMGLNDTKEVVGMLARQLGLRRPMSKL